MVTGVVSTVVIVLLNVNVFGLPSSVTVVVKISSVTVLVVVFVSHYPSILVL
jgi:hypothetical protein